MRSAIPIALVSGVLILWGCGGHDPADAVIGTKRVTETVKVRADLRAIADTLHAYKLERGSWPTAQEGLRVLIEYAGMSERDLTDPWGNSYIYHPPAHRDAMPRLLSAGPDGRVGTVDDITLPW